MTGPEENRLKEKGIITDPVKAILHTDGLSELEDLLLRCLGVLILFIMAFVIFFIKASYFVVRKILPNKTHTYNSEDNSNKYRILKKKEQSV